MSKYQNVNRFHIINIDTQDKNLLEFLKEFGFHSFTSQHEMILEL